MKKLKIISVMVTAVFLVACSDGGQAMIQELVMPSAPAPAPIADTWFGSASTDRQYFTSGWDVSAESTEITPITATNQNQGRRIRRTSTINLTAPDITETSESIRQVVNDFGGYIESSSMSQNWMNLWNMHYVLRVPVDYFDTINDIIQTFGEVTNASVSSEDITDQVYDAQNRLELRLQEESRLMYMLEGTETMADILEIEHRLANVRITIERYRRTAVELDHSASFSTIRVSIQEGETEEAIIPLGFWSRIGDGFASSISFSSMLAQNIVVFLATMILPVLILAVPITFYIIIRKKIKKSKSLA